MLLARFLLILYHLFFICQVVKVACDGGGVLKVGLKSDFFLFFGRMLKNQKKSDFLLKKGVSPLL